MKTVWCVALMCFSWLWAGGQSTSNSSTNDLVKRAESGDAEAQFQLGRAYEDGKDIPQDDGLAASWYKKSAEQGNASAQNDLGLMYRHGRGVSRNTEEAARWFARAAMQCQPNGAYNLGIAYYNGEGVDRDSGLAFVWLLVAKQCGNSEVDSAMDLISSEMKIKQRESAEAKFVNYVSRTPEFKPDVEQLFKQMARLNPPLAFDICKAYATPSVRWHNDEKAEIWCRQALTMKYADAYGILGNLAEQRSDFAEAFKLYTEAVKHDPFTAAGPLGNLYLEGKGTRADPVKAYFWLYVAVKKYYRKPFQSQLQLASRQISEEDRNKQEKRAKDKFQIPQ